MSDPPMPSEPPEDEDPVIAAAIAMLRRDGWLDMRALARQAGIGRATLYRRYGGREDVIGESLARIMERRAQKIIEANRGRGVESVVDTIRAALEYTAHDMTRPSTKLLRDHPDVGIRVLTSSEGKVQPLLLRLIRRVILEELGEPQEVPLDALAYAIERVAEAFYFRGELGGEARDIEAATLIIRQLLS